jgi:thiamine biosynthesis lipoprotein
MNTDILLAAQSGSTSLTNAFKQVQAFIEESECRFTRFSENSELARLNRNTGSWFQASDDLFEIMVQAYDYYLETDGLFNPAILEALKHAGYNRSMDEIRAHGTRLPAAWKGTPQVPDFSQVQMDATNHQIYLPDGMQVDLGGIAKGWIAERAVQILANYSKACAVSAGGDMVLAGIPDGETAWQVSLEDPRDPGQTLAILNVGPGAVATSSVTKRRWIQGERERHHLIDPRTGNPAETDWLSATVITPDAAAAEVYAKAFLIAGEGGVSTLLAQRDDLAFIIVDRDGTLWGNDRSLDYTQGALPISRPVISGHNRSL